MRKNVEPGAEVSCNIKQNLEQRYRQNIRNYFCDKTEEGRIFKYAKMEEDAFMLEEILEQPHEYVQAIYESEYREKYGRSAG